MRNMSSITRTLTCILFVTSTVGALSGCTKSGEKNEGATNTPGSSGGRAATTACGVVYDGKLQNPIPFADGQKVTVVDVMGNNLVAVTADGGASRTVVKLQGVKSALSTELNNKAIERIKSMTSGGAYFYKATKDCNAGSSGTIGSLLTTNGLSLNEEMVKTGLAPADTNDACRGDLLGPCLQALNESAGEDQTSSNVGCGFLWKPVSDKDGNLVVLADECSVRVFVNGEELQQAGAGNGRCTTARGNKPGCAYGQAEVQIFDTFTGLPLVFKNGETKLQLSGCSRFELPCDR